MKKYFMPENNATYLKDKDASKCTPFTGIKNKQKTYAHQKVSAVCSMHSYLNFSSCWNATDGHTIPRILYIELHLNKLAINCCHLNKHACLKDYT